MGTYVKRGQKTRAIVRKAGKTLTKTCDSVAEAKSWIAEQETTLKKRSVFAGGMTLGQVLARYVAEVIDKRPYSVGGMHYAKHIAEFGHTELFDMDARWWLNTVQGWQVSPASSQRYLCEIKSALRRAKLWGVTVDWDSIKDASATLREQGMLSPSGVRSRRLEPGEFVRLRTHMRAHLPLADIIDFALATAMRVGEICRVRFSDVDEVRKMILVRQRKHPTKKMTNDQWVPLLGDALSIIKRQPRTQAEIFPHSAQCISQAFRITRDAAGITDLHFHDLRHEAISRLFEQGFSIPEVCLVSGHQDWAMLKRYTNLKPESLHLGPIAHRRAA